ncbi:hydrogenase-4 transcriptional activator [Bryobacterales bacterium F-183]|nr:hydrogenase-4 transcriptional activator [Bryobacterales bacterium F-183]
MRLEPLPSILLALAEQRSLAEVLRQIVEIVARQDGVAMARVWLREPGDDGALHLRASAGRSITGADWSRIDGTFARVDLANTKLKIAHMALTGESIRIPDLTQDHAWVRHPEWAQAEQLVSFSGHALVFRGESLGVLAVFRRVASGDDCFAWLGTMANAAAIAIANARAFEENERLRRELEQERDYLMEEVEATGSFGEILGKSPALLRVLHQVEMVAPTGANTLILGESGTGKELVARAIHQRSPRAKKPLVKVNCGSIPRELFESEFFGHVRGSFTGAVRDRVGRFQLADGGTLFLDEVGEIPLELQTKLLRVLQEGEFEPVGDDRTRRVNVRVIAATNRDLRKEIDAGRFRLDLYYRLAVFPIELPPLRERSEDIPDLLSHFVRQAAEKFHMAAPAIPQREVERARAYAWPGNVRQLQNAAERAVIVSSGGGRLALDLPVAAKTVAAAVPRVSVAGEVIPEERWREMEKANIEAALAQCGGKISGSSGAAELLGLKPGTLASRMKVLGVKRTHGHA